MMSDGSPSRPGFPFCTDDWWCTEAPPTWLAFGFTIVAVLFTFLAYSRERRRDRQEQASHVAVWPNKARLDEAQFGLINNSALPVYSVVIYVYIWKLNQATVPMGWFDIGVTPPLGSPHYFRTGLRVVDYDAEGYLYAMSFRDSQNRDWYRTRKGKLKKGTFHAASWTQLHGTAGQGHGMPG